MILDYKETEQKITEELISNQNQLNNLYQTMAEVQEYGYKVTFGGISEEEAIKSAFEAGRAIGVLEGENDQLRHFLDFLYNKEFNN